MPSRGFPGTASTSGSTLSILILDWISLVEKVECRAESGEKKKTLLDANRYSECFEASMWMEISTKAELSW